MNQWIHILKWQKYREKKEGKWSEDRGKEKESMRKKGGGWVRA